MPLMNSRQPVVVELGLSTMSMDLQDTIIHTILKTAKCYTNYTIHESAAAMKVIIRNRR